jgi:AcrR family transcriptional regulator
MGLFATMPVDEVTVQDVASAVEMTPAAVYYHFASKEQILLEGMEHFRDQLLAEVRAAMPAAGDADGVRKVVVHVLAWVGRHRTPATVYFVNSLGLNLLVEALRRETRLELVGLLREAVVAARGKLARAEAGVIAVGLVSLIETSLASMLNQDATHRSLGSRRFVQETGHLADRIAGIPLAS